MTASRYPSLMFRSGVVVFAGVMWVTALLHAQPGNTAPDDKIAAIRQLVQENKRAEAAMLVSMLRQLHPEDKRLVDLSQQLAEAASMVGGSAARNTRSGATESRGAVAPPAFTVLERVQMTAIESLARELSELPAGSAEMKQKCTELMTRTEPLVSKYPGFSRLWVIRATAALRLDNFNAGYQAGERILALAEAMTPDEATMEVLGQLELKGWIGDAGRERKQHEARAEEARKVAEARVESERKEREIRVEAERKEREERVAAEQRAQEGRIAREREVWRNPSGSNLTISDLALDLVWLPQGTFSMGSANGEKDERPVLRVTLSAGFWMGRTEVTQAQWQAVMGNNPSEFPGSDRPVEQVSWEDAMDFCRKLSERERRAGRLPEGFDYTLPTEAQWEYTCRAGTTGDYAGTLSVMAWYGQKAGSGTHPVARKQANAWGLHDMHGNVSEWCRDWYSDEYTGHPGGTVVSNPTGASSGSLRVFRGGRWVDAAAFCRSAFRARSSPADRDSGLGFRLALSSIR